MDDIFFGVRSTDPAIREKLARYAIDEAEIALAAGIQSAAAQRNFPIRPEDGSLLFLIQVREDRSQISKGAFLDPRAYEPALRDLFGQYDHVHIKRHPFQRADAAFDHLMSLAPSASETDQNVDSLMSTGQITGVGSFSSSVGYEATYFGKTSHVLFRPPGQFALNGAVPSQDEYVGVYSAFLSVDFWADLLSDQTPTQTMPGIAPLAKPNRLRASLRTDWGFSKIDTDFFVDQAVGQQIRRLEARGAKDPPRHIRRDAFPIDVTGWLRLGKRALPLATVAISVRPGASERHVAFGPYLTLAKGSYRFVMEIEKAQGGVFRQRDASIAVDIAAGDVSLARIREDQSAGRDRRVRLETEFHLDAAETEGVEFRIWADEKTAFDILLARLERC
jgi:hypothetical protein